MPKKVSVGQTTKPYHYIGEQGSRVPFDAFPIRHPFEGDLCLRPRPDCYRICETRYGMIVASVTDCDPAMIRVALEDATEKCLKYWGTRNFNEAAENMATEQQKKMLRRLCEEEGQ